MAENTNIESKLEERTTPSSAGVKDDVDDELIPVRANEDSGPDFNSKPNVDVDVIVLHDNHASGGDTGQDAISKPNHVHSNSGTANTHAGVDSDWREVYEPPIDHGYAWFIVVGCFLMNVLFTGSFKSIGILFVEIREEYGASPGIVSWLVGLFGISWALCAPLATGLGRRHGARRIVIFGGILCALGPILTAFAPNIMAVIFFYGLLTGIGSGFAYGPSYILVVQYFNKRRSLANGIAVAGSSVGQLLFPLLLRHLVDTYGYRNSLILIGGINLNIVLSGALYRPLDFYKRKVKIRKTTSRIKVSEIESLLGDDRSLDAKPSSDSSKLPINKQLKKLKLEDGINCSSESLKDVKLESEKLVDSEDEAGSIHEGKKSVYRYASNLSLVEASVQAHEDHIQRQLRDSTATDIAQKKYGCLKTCLKGSPSEPPLFNFALLRSAVFMFFAISVMVNNLAYSSQFMYLPPYCKEIGISKETTAMVMSIMGVGDLVARLFCGWFGDLGYIERRHIVAIGMTVPGLMSIILPFIKSYPTFLIYSIIIGVFGGTFIALLAVVLVDFVGIELLEPAFGNCMAFAGIGFLIGPTLMGQVRTATGNYDLPFHIGGVFNIMGAVLLLMYPLAKKIDDRKTN
ncbi:unnamed protein product [Owenia fusiformis]|uniref:Uncharacterized protein n=1 Tax=Owenia fusiformis TaxID=6347 RepID=A0A8J1Y9A8_OWEFU|nr:unnamed protein product [Owenia fusiformis]